VGPDADDSGVVTVPEPIGNLFDGGLLEVVGESGLAVTGGILNAGNGEWRTADGEGESRGDDTLVADQVLDAGLLDPAVGLVGFEFEFRDGLDGVTGRGNFRFIRLETRGLRRWCAPACGWFLCRSGRKRFDGVGEDTIVVVTVRANLALTVVRLGQHTRDIAGLHCQGRSSFAEAMEDKGGF